MNLNCWWSLLIYTCIKNVFRCFHFSLEVFNIHCLAWSWSSWRGKFPSSLTFGAHLIRFSCSAFRHPSAAVMPGSSIHDTLNWGQTVQSWFNQSRKSCFSTGFHLASLPWSPQWWMLSASGAQSKVTIGSIVSSFSWLFPDGSVWRGYKPCTMYLCYCSLLSTSNLSADLTGMINHSDLLLLLLPAVA